MADRSIRIELRGDSSGYRNAAKQVRSDTQGILTDLGNLGNVITGAFFSLQMAGQALHQTFQRNIGVAIEYESAFTGVRKTVDATEEEFAQLSKNLLDLSATIPISTTELARMMEVAGQLGVTGVERLTKFTSTAAILGATTNVVGEQAALSIARIFNVLGDELTGGLDNVDRFGASLVDLGNKVEANEDEILNFTRELALAGRTARLVPPELMGISAALAATGLRAELAGTNFQGFVNTIDIASTTGGEKLDLFAKTAGRSAEEFARLWRERPVEAILAFLEGLKAVQDSQTNIKVVLDDLGLAGDRSIRLLGSLASTVDDVKRAIDLGTTAWADNTAAVEEADKRFSTSESKIKLLEQAWKRLNITIGKEGKPALDAMTESTTGLVDALNEWVQTGDESDRTLKAIGVGAATSIPSLVGLAGQLGILLLGVRQFIPHGLFAGRSVATVGAAAETSAAQLAGLANTTGAAAIAAKNIAPAATGASNAIAGVSTAAQGSAAYVSEWGAVSTAAGASAAAAANQGTRLGQVLVEVAPKVGAANKALGGAAVAASNLGLASRILGSSFVKALGPIGLGVGSIIDYGRALLHAIDYTKRFGLSFEYLKPYWVSTVEWEHDATDGLMAYQNALTLTYNKARRLGFESAEEMRAFGKEVAKLGMTITEALDRYGSSAAALEAVAKAELDLASKHAAKAADEVEDAFRKWARAHDELVVDELARIDTRKREMVNFTTFLEQQVGKDTDTLSLYTEETQKAREDILAQGDILLESWRDLGSNLEGDALLQWREALAKYPELFHTLVSDTGTGMAQIEEILASLPEKAREKLAATLAVFKANLILFNDAMADYRVVYKGMPEHVQTALGEVGTLIAEQFPVLTAALDTEIDALGNVTEKFSTKFNLADVTREQMTAVVQALEEEGYKVAQKIDEEAGTLELTWERAGVVLGSAADKAMQKQVQAVARLSEQLGAPFDAAKTTISHFIDDVDGLSREITIPLGNLSTWTEEAFTKWDAKLSAKFERVEYTIDNASGDIYAKVQDLGSDLRNAFDDVEDKIDQAAPGVGTALKRLFGNMIGTAESFVDEFGDVRHDFVLELEALKNATPEQLRAVAEAFRFYFGDIVDVTKTDTGEVIVRIRGLLDEMEAAAQQMDNLHDRLRNTAHSMLILTGRGIGAGTGAVQYDAMLAALESGGFGNVAAIGEQLVLQAAERYAGGRLAVLGEERKGLLAAARGGDRSARDRIKEVDAEIAAINKAIKENTLAAYESVAILKRFIEDYKSTLSTKGFYAFVAEVRQVLGVDLVRVVGDAFQEILEIVDEYVGHSLIPSALYRGGEEMRKRAEAIGRALAPLADRTRGYLEQTRRVVRDEVTAITAEISRLPGVALPQPGSAFQEAIDALRRPPVPGGPLGGNDVIPGGSLRRPVGGASAEPVLLPPSTGKDVRPTVINQFYGDVDSAARVERVRRQFEQVLLSQEGRR